MTQYTIYDKNIFGQLHSYRLAVLLSADFFLAIFV